MYQARSIIPQSKRFVWPDDKPPFGARLNRKHPLAKGLIGAWVMNERAGNRLIDLSGNGNDGTIVTANWASNGLYCDGVNDYAYTGTVNHNIGTGDFTWSVLMKPHRLTNSYEGVIGNAYYMPGLYARRSGSNWGTYWGGAKDSGNDLIVDNWYLLTMLRTGSTIKFYENGVQTPNEYIQSSSMANNIFRIGAINSTASNRGNFTTKEVLFHNRALSEDEIVWLNSEPYAMLQPAIDPTMMYYTTPSGLTILDYERAIGRGICRGVV